MSITYYYNKFLIAYQCCQQITLIDGPQILATQKYIVGQGGGCCCRRHILGCGNGGGRGVGGGEGATNFTLWQPIFIALCTIR